MAVPEAGGSTLGLNRPRPELGFHTLMTSSPGDSAPEDLSAGRTAQAGNVTNF